MSEVESRDWEDEQILSLLDEMAEGSVEDPWNSRTGDDDAGGLLRRGYVESLAMLPFELPPLTPPEEIKARILAEVDGGARTGTGSGSVSSFGGAAKPPRRWLLPLAAALMFVVAAGWQNMQTRRQDRDLAQLRLEVEQAWRYAEELTAVRAELAETRARLEIMTASSAEFCVLRPTVSCPNQEAFATLVMQRGGSDWYLRAKGLGPCELGRQYKLWFVTEFGPVLGASFAVKDSHDLIEIRANGAPTGVKAIMITLEQPDVETAPESEALLYGDERMRIL